jgi:hypothetical protein
VAPLFENGRSGRADPAVTGFTVALEPPTPHLKRLPALATVVLPYRFGDVS